MQILNVIIYALFAQSTSKGKNKNKNRNKHKNKINSNKNILKSPSTSTPEQPSKLQTSRLRWAKSSATEPIILVDVENVRGKSNFELTHFDLLRRTFQWSSVHDLENRIVMVVDHGSIPSAFYLPSSSMPSDVGEGEGDIDASGLVNSGVGLSVVFAGTRLKADDVLVRDVTYFNRDVLLVTADNELMSRCRTAVWDANKKSGKANNDENGDGEGIEIQFVHPLSFICDLEAAMAKGLENDDDSITTIESTSQEASETKNQLQLRDDVNQNLLDAIDQEVKIRGSMYDTEMQMRQKRNMNTPKKRRKLEKRARMLCERLAMKGGQNIDHIISVGTNGNGGVSSITKYDRMFQNEVLKQWAELRRTATRKEMTGDRMMLAEYFRRQIEEKVPLTINQTPTMDDVGDSGSNSDLPIKKDTNDYVGYVNDMFGSKGVTALSPSAVSSTMDNISYRSSEDDKSLRLVIISDTHGFEEHLTPNGITLPPGDILLHLGDFCIDGSIKKKVKAIAKFDEWLSRQPHRTKIVLRGNHDPFRVKFPLSNADFYSKPNSIAIDDGRLAMALVPYCSPRALSSSWRKMSIFADVLASHSPPFNVLDQCYNGNNAGCASLRGKVEKMIAGPPRLWVCGHIHEGRGSTHTKFGFSSRETLVINASNANCGRATCIKHGPIVVDIDENNDIIQVDQEKEKDKDKYVVTK